MDLGAYANIEELSKIAEKNGIEVPRLRGYRLMENEKPITDEELKSVKGNMAIVVAESLVRSCPMWDASSCVSEYSSYTDWKAKYYMICDKDGNFIGIRWDRIHGKHRKVLKFGIKRAFRDIDSQFALWNKYAGKRNVLYIHSRIGGDNWNYYNGNALREKEWFLDKVDDYFDSTYCDIYAEIKGR